MRKLHVTVVSLLLAAATVLGATSLVRTTGLGAASRSTNDAAVAAKEKQLATYEAKLRAVLAAKAPALPPLPKTAGGAPTPTTAAPQQRVVYRRPPPVVVVQHASHGDDGYERADGGGGDD
jgi:hypothetical protein